MNISKIVGYIACVVVIIMICVSDRSFAAPISGVGRKDIVNKFNQDPVKIIDDSTIIGNPISNGSNLFVGKSPLTSNTIEGVVKTENNNYPTVLTSTMEKIKKVVDYALGLLALIATIYLIIQGLRILLNPEDDKVQAQALDGIKTVAWALGGIGLSRLIVSFVFFLVGLLAG